MISIRYGRKHTLTIGTKKVWTYAGREIVPAEEIKKPNKELCDTLTLANMLEEGRSTLFNVADFCVSSICYCQNS